MTTNNKTNTERTVDEIAKKILSDNGGIDEVDDPNLFRDIKEALLAERQQAEGEKAELVRGILKAEVQACKTDGISIPVVTVEDIKFFATRNNIQV